MGEQREGRGESAACAGTADRDAIDVDVQVVRSFGQSAQRGVGVLDRGGRGMVRPQSIANRGDGDAEFAGEGDVRTVVLLGCAEDQSASVYPEQRRSRCLQAGRLEDAKRDGRGALGPGHEDLLDPDVRPWIGRAPLHPPHDARRHTSEGHLGDKATSFEIGVEGTHRVLVLSPSSRVYGIVWPPGGWPASRVGTVVKPGPQRHAPNSRVAFRPRCGL